MWWHIEPLRLSNDTGPAADAVQDTEWKWMQFAISASGLRFAHRVRTWMANWFESDGVWGNCAQVTQLCIHLLGAVSHGDKTTSSSLRRWSQSWGVWRCRTNWVIPETKQGRVTSNLDDDNLSAGDVWCRHQNRKMKRCVWILLLTTKNWGAWHLFIRYCILSTVERYSKGWLLIFRNDAASHFTVVSIHHVRHF